jgi:hypothetical protein
VNQPTAQFTGERQFQLSDLMNDTVSAYGTKAGVLAGRAASSVCRIKARPELIPHGRDLVALDVGAGSARDTA